MVTQDAGKELEHVIGEVSLDRGKLYQLLGDAVLFPTIDLAESLLNGCWHSMVEKSVLWINGRENIYDSSLEKLKKVAQIEEKYHPEDLLRKMEEEYKRLFHNPCQVVTSPFESVKKAYRAEKTYIMPNHKVAIDHISFQLYFLSHLAKQEGESWKNGDVTEAKKWKIKERTFLVHHLRKFGITFFENFEKQAETEAYQAIASIGKIFMILEHGF